MDLFPIKFTGRASGFWLLVIGIVGLLANVALWFGAALVIAWGASIGWGLG